MAFWSSVLPAVIGGGLGFFGSERRNRAQVSSAREAMGFEAEEARKQREFQERMSNTAVARRQADLRRSGINPILAGRYDASAPSGAMGTGIQADIADSIGAGVSSAMALTRQKDELKSSKQQRNLSRAQEYLNDRLATKAMYEGSSAREKYVQEKMHTIMLEKQKPYLEKMYKTLGEFEGTKTGEFMRILREFLPFMNSAKGLAR